MNPFKRRKSDTSAPTIAQEVSHCPFPPDNSSPFGLPNSSDVPAQTPSYQGPSIASTPSPRHTYVYPPSPSPPPSSPPLAYLPSLKSLPLSDSKSLSAPPAPNYTTKVVPVSPPLFKARSRLRDGIFGGIHLEKPPSTASTSKTGYSASYQQSIVAKSLIGETTVLGEDGALKRDWDFFASWSIGMLNVGFLPGVFFGVLTTQECGGSSMIIVGWLLSGVFMTCLVTVLSEFSGAYPVAGAMFTWVFRLCRVSSSPFKGSARFLSWLAGSFLLCSHILAQIALSWQFATVIQGCVKVYIHDYQSTIWRTLGIAWGNIFLCVTAVCFPLSRSPMLWRLAGLLLIFTFCFFNIALLVATPHKRSAYEIFTSYENKTNFSTKGYVYLLGWVLTTLATGMDACAHMAEETKAPARTVPSAMFWTSVGSYSLGWISLYVYLACDKPRTNTTIETIPMIRWEPSRILITNLSPALTVTTLALILAVMFLQDVAQLLASSRFVWALARDKAIPLSPTLRRLSRRQLPISATWSIGLVVSLCICLIAVNRELVNNLIIKGTGVAIFIAYIFPVVVYLCCDRDCLVVDGRNMWTVRKLARPLSFISILFVAFVLVCMCLPNNIPLTALTFPWAPIVAIGVLITSTSTWIFYGNSRYAGPIKATLGPSVELPKSQPPKQSDNAEETTDEVDKTAQVWVRSLSTVPVSEEGENDEIRPERERTKYQVHERPPRATPGRSPVHEVVVAERERRIRLQTPGQMNPRQQDDLTVDSQAGQILGFPYNLV